MTKISKTNQKMAHELVAETAKQMAGAFYELAASNNDFYKHYPNQQMFIGREYKRFIEVAKRHLSGMLGLVETPEYQKEIIFEALILHSSLPGNMDRRVAAQIAHPSVKIDGGSILPKLTTVH